MKVSGSHTAVAMGPVILNKFCDWVACKDENKTGTSFWGLKKLIHHDRKCSLSSTAIVPCFLLVSPNRAALWPNFRVTIHVITYRDGNPRNHAIWRTHPPTSAVPNLFGTGDQFVEDNFSTDGGVGDGSGGNTSDGERWGATGSDGERQMRLRSLARRSPPAVWPGS